MNEIQEDYVTLETAQLLKEKGFDEECRDYYSTDKELSEFVYFDSDRKNSTLTDIFEEKLCTAPTQALVCKWLWKTYQIYLTPRIGFGKPIWWDFMLQWDEGSQYHISEDSYPSPEQATEQAILYTLKYLLP